MSKIDDGLEFYPLITHDVVGIKPSLSHCECRKSALRTLQNKGENGVAILKLEEFLASDGDIYLMPTIIDRQAPAHIIAEWKASRHKPTEDPKPANQLTQAHIGFNYQRWCDPEAVKSYSGLSRLLVEATNIGEDDVPEWQKEEWRNALEAGGGYACINLKPKHLQWSGNRDIDEDCGWWNAGTDGTLTEYYSDMMAYVERFVKYAGDKLKYIEVENEPNRWWNEDTNLKYTPTQWSALQKAAYKTVKSVNPNIKVVLAGLSNFDTDYLNQTFNGVFPIQPLDIIAAHYYCSKGNDGAKVLVTSPASPHDCGFEAACETFMQFCKDNYPGIPVWLGEMGYSSNESTEVSHDANLEVLPYVGAAYTLEMAKIAIEAGFERVQIFQLQDLGDYDLYGRTGHYFSAEEPGGKARTIKKLGTSFNELYQHLPTGTR